MGAVNQNKEAIFKVKVGLPVGKEWSAAHLADIKDFIKKEAQKYTPEQKLTTKLQAIQYEMEEYLEDNAIDANKMHPVERFLNAYLKVLNLSFKKFAINLDTTDGNLKKYLSGERKFNTDLAMKFGSFFHTPPDLWINVHTKNELLLFKKEKAHIRKYKKYDYKNMVHLTGV